MWSSQVEVTLRRGPRHLPVHEAEELELGVDLGQVDLHPVLVDDVSAGFTGLAG